MVIEKCVDQDGALLPITIGVSIYVGENENIMVKKWVQGEPISFALPAVIKATRIPVRVSLDTPDMLFSPIEPVTIEKNQTKRLVLQFYRVYKLNIQAADRSGKPLPDVHLAFGNCSATTDYRGQAVMAVADPRLRGGMPLNLQIVKPGFSPTSADAGKITLNRGKFDYALSITMAPGLPSRSFSIDVTVVDNQGQSVENAQVYFGDQFLGTTNGSGMISPIAVALAANESKSVRAQKEGYASGRTEPAAAARYSDTQGSYRYKIHLIKSATPRKFDLVVDVMDQSTGKGVADAAVLLDGQRIGRSGRNGRLSLNQLSLVPGQSRVIRADKMNYKFLRAEPQSRISYADCQSTCLITLYLQPQGTPPPTDRIVDIAVVVKDSASQSSLSGVAIAFNGAEIGKSDASGNFTRQGYLLKSGEVLRISASKAGYTEAVQPLAILRHADSQTKYQITWLMVAASAKGGNCEKMVMLAEAAAKRNEDRKAIEYYKQITPPVNSADKECYINALNQMGLLYLKMREYESAVESFKKGLSLDSQDYALHLNLAKTYFQSSNYDLTNSQLIEVEKLKFVIPAAGGLRQEVLLNVKYIRALCEYGRYQVEPNNDRREILRVSTYRYFEDFMYQVPQNDDKYKYMRVDAKEKMGRLEGQ